MNYIIFLGYLASYILKATKIDTTRLISLVVQKVDKSCQLQVSTLYQMENY